MMKKILLMLLLLLMFSPGCVTPEQVSKNVLHELEVKYGRKFIVHSIDMNHDEGNWGSANMVICPAGDESLKFRVNYNYSDMKLTWEEYKGALWNRELSMKAASILGMPGAVINANITSKNSLAFDSMSLPYHERFADAVKDIDRPRLSLEVKMKSSVFAADTALFVKMTGAFLDMGFEKVSVTATLDKGNGITDTLRFKVTKKYRSPSHAELESLLESNMKKSLKKAQELYDRASEFSVKGENGKALQLFKDIVKAYDNPYRYGPYVLLESHCVIESAFKAAVILEESGRINEAMKYYILVKERLEYHEVRAELNERYKLACEKLAAGRN